VSREQPDKSFLGTGWSFPPTFSRQTFSVEMVRDDQDIKESLLVLFSTQLGERVMVPKYGTQLWRMIFRNINSSLLTQMEEIVRQAILYWEPRIDVNEVVVRPDATVAGLVNINVAYTIRQINARSNLVYPFYLGGDNQP
jgi:phage baseplate assembly protein W